MVVLRFILLLTVCLMAIPAHGHHMGRTVPIGYTVKSPVHLAAQVVASYFEEQMGRETKLIKAGSALEGIQSVRDREYPMAVLPAAAVGDLPEGVSRLQGLIGVESEAVVLIIGKDAREKLEFSLVQKYLDKLSQSLIPADWERSLKRVRAGEGVRGVALDMLREKDLL